MNEHKYLVAIQCFTYNHSQYVLDALNGFVNQQTSFPFIIMIVDDASIDGEQEVIRNFITDQFNLADTNVAYEKETDYAHITYAQHLTNLNCYIVALFLKENHYSQHKRKLPYLSDWRDGCKYEAICEGDDYWIDPLKLQTQVNFLETNPDYVLSYSDKIVVNEKGKRMITNRLSGKSGDLFDYLLFKGNPITTASTCFRIDAYSKVQEKINDIDLRHLIIGDYPTWIIMSKLGKIQYVDTKMTAYRVLSNSASHSSNPKYIENFYREELRIKTKLYKEYTGKDASSEFEKSYYKTLIRKMVQYDKKIFFKYYKEGIKRYPILLFSPKLIFFFLYKFCH